MNEKLIEYVIMQVETGKLTKEEVIEKYRQMESYL